MWLKIEQRIVIDGFANAVRKIHKLIKAIKRADVIITICWFNHLYLSFF